MYNPFLSYVFPIGEARKILRKLHKFFDSHDIILEPQVRSFLAAGCYSSKQSDRYWIKKDIDEAKIVQASPSVQLYYIKVRDPRIFGEE